MFKFQLVTACLLSFIVLLTACVPSALPTLQNLSVPTSTRVENTELSPESETVAMTIRQMLMQQLSADFDAITVKSVTAQEWPDGCLGLPAADEFCTMATLPGYEVTLALNGETYVYRSDTQAINIRLAQAPAIDLDETLLTWTQYLETGSCAQAHLSAAEVAFGQCGGLLLKRKQNNPDYRQDLAGFINTYAPFETMTPAGQLVFKGKGQQTVTPAEQRMLAEWARLAYEEARAGRSGASWGLALAWHREGGSAGFCDALTVYRTGLVYASSCKGDEPQNLGKTRLDADQLTQLYTWVDEFQNFEMEEKDPAVADAMSVQVIFSGTGQAPVSTEVQADIERFAASLFAQLSQ